MKKLLLHLIIGSVLIGGEVFASTVSTTFTASLTVSSNCVMTATALVFGAYDPLSATPNDASSNIAVTCTQTTPYHVRFDKGVHGSSVTNRKLSDGGINTLNYAIFRDSGRTLNWGETDTVDTTDSTGTGIAQSFNMYGRIAALQAIPSGSYSDTVTVTISF